MDIRKEICDRMSRMLDNPDDCGIYPTTEFMDSMEMFIKNQIEETKARYAGDLAELSKRCEELEKALNNKNS